MGRLHLRDDEQKIEEYVAVAARVFGPIGMGYPADEPPKEAP